MNKKTDFYEKHVELGAKIVEFGGWDMPIQYPEGVIAEHLATRKAAGIFDVSHMGRFIVGGRGALPFLQHILTNNAAALEVGKSQYTIIANENGGAIDDAYLYRFEADQYTLVVNASNREKDWEHFQNVSEKFENVELFDKTHEIAMVSLQGPASKHIMQNIIESGVLPEPVRNSLSIVKIKGAEVCVARTGYTGEPICFELFIPKHNSLMIWDLLLEKGAKPVGLGARDTLRLEAGLPLYGHEFGIDPENKEIPIFACSLSRFAVSFTSLKGDFIGKTALEKQFNALKKIIDRDYSFSSDLPRIILPIALVGRGIARAGDKIFVEGKQVGYVTSGTMVPFWKVKGEGVFSRFIDEKDMRAICLGLIDCDILDGDKVEIEIRKRKVQAVVVPYHMRSEAPPYARAILYDQIRRKPYQKKKLKKRP